MPTRYIAPLLALSLISAQSAVADVPWQFRDEALPESFAFRGRLAAQASAPKGSQVQLAIHYEDGQPHLELSLGAEAATLSLVSAGAHRTITKGRFPKPKPDASFKLFRDRWRVVLTVNGRWVLSGYENTLTGGKLGIRQLGTGLTIASGSFQRLGEIYLTDDFTRAKGQEGEWEILSGNFQLHEQKATKKTQQVFSANTFRWQSAPEKRNLAAAGYWFWRNYHFAVSVRSTGAGHVGLCVWLQDADNYVALVCESGAAPDRSQIVRVRDGKTTVLARIGSGLLAGQWHRLDVKAVGGRIEARIDGKHSGAADVPDWRCGQVGLLAEGHPVHFDDVSVASTDGFHAGPSNWPNTSAVALPRMPKASLLAIGDASWADPICRLSSPTRSPVEVLVLYGLSSPDDCGLLHIRRSPKGASAELVRRAGQKEQSFGTASLPARYSRLALQIRGHVVSLAADGRCLLSAYDAGRTSGPMGIAMAAGRWLPFGQADVSLPTPLYPPSEMNPRFAAQATMSNWSSPAASWRADASGIFWYGSPLYGDFEIELPITKLLRPNEHWELRLSDHPGAGGALLALKADPAKSEHGLSLSVQGKPVAQGAITFAEAQSGAPLRLSRHGRCLAVQIGARAVLGAEAADEGCYRLGFRRIQTSVVVNHFQIEAAGTLDDAFSGAPVKWWAERGDWDVRPRWPCDDRWSFLGGINSESPVLWSKFAFAGDMAVDAWVALYMDNPKEPTIGYKHISDLNVTICGDGRNLASGYSCQFAAKHNTVSQIRRLEKVVAETPKMVMVSPRRLNVPWQRHWYHLRVERSGGRVAFSVDGRPALEFDDPKPLAGGHVGLWTWRGGLMVARVRVAAQRVTFPERQTLSPLGRSDPHSSWVAGGNPAGVACSFNEGIGGWMADAAEPGTELAFASAGGRLYLNVRNRVSGGSFRVAPGLKPFDASKFFVLSFDFRADPGTAVNLYLAAAGQRLVIPLTAGELEPNQSALLPPANVKADGKWHAATYKLLEVLKAKCPQAKKLIVQGLEFGAPFAEYLRSGFGGNHYGCTYSLDNFALRASAAVTPEEAKALLP